MRHGTMDQYGIISGVSALVLILQLLLLGSSLGGSTASTDVRDSPSHKENSIFWDYPYSAQPSFDNTTEREVIASVGQVAYLHCRVFNIGDRAVSWIRKRDLHILTIGIMTYTNDQRFQSEHVEGSNAWTLKVLSPQPRDNGIYECQVSTEPKISLAYRLNVVVSKAKIMTNSEMYIKSGNDINLTCVTMQAPTPPLFIYWYKNGNIINYAQRGGINIITERQSKTSKLIIDRATTKDSGNYTCSPSDSEPDSVIVHVIRGENSAAMQHENSSARTWAHRQALSIVPLAGASVAVIYGLGLLMTIDGRAVAGR